MRIACHGWVLRDGGSIAGAAWLMLRELLDLGHTIDLYAQTAHVYHPGYEHPTFHFHEFDVGTPPWLERVAELLPARLQFVARIAFGRLWLLRMRRHVPSLVLEQHQREPFDLSLHLGVAPVFRVPGRPTVVWPQGAKGLERQALRNNRRLVQRVSGKAAYYAAVAHYTLRDRMGWRWLPGVHLISASSLARRAAVAGGADPRRAAVVPYPIASSGGVTRPRDPHAMRFLVAGRLDARKRIDLAIDAVIELRRRGHDAQLDIIGSDGALPGWEEFVEGQATDAIRFHGRVPHDQALDLIDGSHVVLQTSENEEFGSAVAEALVAGVPVVVGPTNGTREWVAPGTGAVFRSYSPSAVADALLQAHALSLDPGTAARCKRESAIVFEPAAVGARLERVLLDAAGGSGGAG